AAAHAALEHRAEVFHHVRGHRVVARAGDLHAALALLHLHGAARHHHHAGHHGGGHPAHRAHARHAHARHAHPHAFHHHRAHHDNPSWAPDPGHASKPHRAGRTHPILWTGGLTTTGSVTNPSDKGRRFPEPGVAFCQICYSDQISAQSAESMLPADFLSTLTGIWLLIFGHPPCNQNGTPATNRFRCTLSA